MFQGLAEIAIFYFIAEAVIGRVDQWKSFLLKTVVISVVSGIASAILYMKIGEISNLLTLPIYLILLPILLNIDFMQSVIIVGFFALYRGLMLVLCNFIPSGVALIILFLLYVLVAKILRKPFHSA